MRFDRRDSNILGHWWWTVDRQTLAAIAAIAATGLVLLMAASPPVAERIGAGHFHFVAHQAVFLGAGSLLLIFFSLMSPRGVRQMSVLGFLACLALMISVLLFGEEVKGAKRWIFIAGFSLQPSEFMKPFFAVLTAWVLARKHMDKDFPGFRAALALYALVAILLVLQPNFSMTLAVSAVWGAQMFLAGLPVSWIVIAGGGGLMGIVAAYFLLPHVAHRIDMFLDPGSGDNFQSEKSLEAFVNGGFLGQGPGEGQVKMIIPDAHTDFIFAVAGEELGIIVCLFIVALFAFVVIRGFVRLHSEGDVFVIYAASGLLVQFGLQTAINMGVTLNLLPNTGVTMPFVSYGGSSTLAASIAIGMLLSLTRRRYGAVVSAQ